MALSNVAIAQLAGTAHDFTGENWDTPFDACSVCHLLSTQKTDSVELWNHEATTAAFSVYSSNQMDATVGPPDGASKLCLSCHDGTIAVDSYGGKFGSKYLNGAVNIGIDLSNDHPVSFRYDSNLAIVDGSLKDPTMANSGLGNTIRVDLLSDDKMQCTSCHDPHENMHGNFLVMSNDGDRLCTTCHSK